MSNARIMLFVDDDRHIHDQVRNKFNDYQVISAYSGAQAFEILELSEHKIDLILLDQMMPNMDGLTTFQKMKSKFGDQLPPTILLSGYGSEKLVLAALQIGIASYLNKPILNMKLLQVEIDDVMEKEKLKQQNKLKEKKLQQLFTAVEQSPASVVITDREGKIEYVNPVFSKITGYTFDEVQGQKSRLLKSGNMSTEFYANMWQIICSGARWSGDFCNQTKDGKIFWESASIAPILDEKSEITHFVAVKQDITERKKLEDALTIAKETAENAATIKADFLANMSHEIRTPMNGVIGMVNLLLTTKLDNIQHGYAWNIKNSADTLLSIINDILDFSKIEAGKLDLEIINFDLHSLVENTIEILSLQAQNKGLELVNIVSRQVPTNLKGDPGRLRQILNNLISNAIKFTKIGEIILRVKLVEELDQKVTLRFEVEDRGIGIKKADQEKMFDSFTQADVSTTRRFGGTGLGLSICKQLSKMMAGEIGVESEIGQGSNFWFTAVLEKQLDVKRKIVTLPNNIRQKKILAVDDSQTNLDILDDYLRMWGCRYSLVKSGSEALKLMREAAGIDPFELVIVDYMMPEMDGEMLGKEIKKDSRLKKTKLIMYTSHAQQGDSKRVEKIGFAAYLIKPIKQNQLYQCLQTVLGGNEKGKIVTRHTLREVKPKKSSRKLHVLLVEDNSINQEIAKELLLENGHKVTIAENGQEALKKLQDNNKIDLVLMDVQMPVMDGYETTRAIRQIKKFQKLPIIAMTAHAMQGARERCLAAGMDDYVSKPIRKQLLFLTIEKRMNENGGIADTSIRIETGHEREIFDGLVRENFSDNPMRITKMIDIYLNSKQNQERLDLMQQAIEDNNAELLQKSAHALQGSVSNFSTVTGALAEKLEEMGKSGKLDPARFKVLYAKLVEKSKQLDISLRQYKKKNID
jgi:PAS domain S-box-containing protein